MEALEQLKKWAAAGESELLEFKRSTGTRREAVQTLCAMLNTRGGRVLIGIDPSGRLVGQQVGARTLDELSQEIREIEPPAFPHVERVPVGDDRAVLVITASQGATRPYVVRGTAYRRVGTTTVALSRDEYNSMLMERLHSERRWENEIADGWSISDLDAAEVTRTIDEAIRRGRQNDPGTRDTESLLRGLGLMRDGGITRAAAVLFGRDGPIECQLGQCLLRFARFRGVDKSEFVDNRQFYGNAFRLLARADKLLREYLPVAGRVVPNLFERADDPLYPPVALREALANAICHRDYSIGGGSVSIAIFDDRLEIASSGTLHFGLKIDDLLSEHESLPWNPLMAAVFYRRGVVERWGRGTLVMADLVRRAGLPPPEFEETAGCVVVTFRPSRYRPPEQVRATLTDHQRELLALIDDRGRIALRELKAVQDHRDEWAIKKDLAILKNLGLLDTGGYGRGAYWFRKG